MYQPELKGYKSGSLQLSVFFCSKFMSNCKFDTLIKSKTPTVCKGINSADDRVLLEGDLFLLAFIVFLNILPSYHSLLCWRKRREKLN